MLQRIILSILAVIAVSCGSAGIVKIKAVQANPTRISHDVNAFVREQIKLVGINGRFHDDSYGNDNMVTFKKITDKVQPEGATLRQIFLDYVKAMSAQGKKLDSKVEGRIVIK